MKTAYLIIFFGILTLYIACGGGGLGSGDLTISENLAEEAYTALGVGDIATAQENYDAALAADSDNTTAAFGAALTRIIQLSDSSPSRQILQGLGQSTVPVTNLVGPSSYLAALNEVNVSDTSFDSYTGPFFGRIQKSNREYTRSDDSLIDEAYNQCEVTYEECIGEEIDEDEEEEDPCYATYNSCSDEVDAMDPVGATCTLEMATLEYRDADNTIVFSMGLYLSATEEREDGTTLSYSAAVADSIGVADNLGLSACNRDAIIWIGAETQERWFYLYDNLSTGSVLINQLSDTEGETVEIALQDIILYSGSQSFTLNGTITDAIDSELPDESAYFPFYDQPYQLKFLLGRVLDDLDAADFQGYTMGYQPLFQEILDLLELADQSDAFQFVIPQGLYFGVEDIPVNRVDLKMLQAGFHFALAGLYFGNSWEFPINIGALYDEDGNLLITQAELVDQLNRFFTLKSDHHLDEAQVQTAEGLQTLLDAYDLLDDVTVDGIIEENPLAVGGYSELQNAVSIIQDSLSNQQVFPYIDPTVNISLNHFFSVPPDRSEIDFDPFVLENGQIRPVESFFQQALEGSVDFDATQSYRSAFSAIRGTFKKVVFDEFTTFFAAGTLVFSYDFDSTDIIGSE